MLLRSKLYVSNICSVFTYYSLAGLDILDSFDMDLLTQQCDPDFLNWSQLDVTGPSNILTELDIPDNLKVNMSQQCNQEFLAGPSNVKTLPKRYSKGMKKNSKIDYEDSDSGFGSIQPYKKKCVKKVGESSRPNKAKRVNKKFKNNKVVGGKNAEFAEVFSQPSQRDLYEKYSRMREESINQCSKCEQRVKESQ